MGKPSENHRKIETERDEIWGYLMIYPLANVYKKLWKDERSSISNGKTHYFDWAIFTNKLLNYQMINLMGIGLGGPPRIQDSY